MRSWAVTNNAVSLSIGTTTAEERDAAISDHPTGSPDDRLLHILPQSTYHAPARICGSPEVLKSLGMALIRASWSRAERVAAMARDGECYEIEIEARTPEQMRSEMMPYFAQPGHPWDFDAPERPAHGDEDDGA